MFSNPVVKFGFPNSGDYPHLSQSLGVAGTWGLSENTIFLVGGGGGGWPRVSEIPSATRAAHAPCGGEHRRRRVGAQGIANINKTARDMCVRVRRRVCMRRPSVTIYITMYECVYYIGSLAAAAAAATENRRRLCACVCKNESPRHTVGDDDDDG